MGSLFSKPKTPSYIAPPVAPVAPAAATVAAGEDGAAKEAASREAEKIRGRKKRSQTVWTGPEGIEEKAKTVRETLG